MEKNRPIKNIIPKPVSTEIGVGFFKITPKTKIVIPPENEELLSIANFLAELLSPATGFPFSIVPKAETPEPGNINLSLAAGKADLGKEGYQLSVKPDGAFIAAFHPPGIFWGAQTLRQLFSATIESRLVENQSWEIQAVEIRDRPRFIWRGAMLDVARHFFSVEDVKRFIDLIASYKLNTLHLHLTDDQGWRIEIKSWPNLTAIGGSTCVGGGEGGFYTQKEFAEIIKFAQSRYITVVPEIDLPGHTTSALSSYPELNCDGKAPALYTGMNVGFSSLCIDKEITYKFVADVINETAEITPGPYIHIGGDEAHSTSAEDYKLFIRKAQKIVRKTGKHMIGWQEILHSSDLLPDTIIQYWNHLAEDVVIPPDRKVIVSPGNRVYLDMKYNEDCHLGLNWAGYVNCRDAYDWDPTTQLLALAEEQILGVEAPLWSETVETLKDIEFMVFPRLPGVAEIGWSMQTGRSWEEYKGRLAIHGSRWDIMKVNYYKSPMIPW